MRVKVLRGSKCGEVYAVTRIHTCTFKNTKGATVTLLICKGPYGDIALYSDETEVTQ